MSLALCLSLKPSALQISRAAYPVFKGGCWTCQSGFPIALFTLCGKLIESVRIMGCVVWLSDCHLLRQSRHEDVCDSVTKSLHLHCQAGGWGCIGCTVFMDGGCTLLDSEAPPDITTGLKTKYSGSFKIIFAWFWVCAFFVKEEGVTPYYNWSH